MPSRVHLRCRLCMLCHRDDRTLAFAAPPSAAASCPRGRSSSPSAFCSSWQVPMDAVLSTHSRTTLLPQRELFEQNPLWRKTVVKGKLEPSKSGKLRTLQLLDAKNKMSKDLMSLLVGSCLSVWSGYVHLLFCTQSLIPSSKFQVTFGNGKPGYIRPYYVTARKRASDGGKTRVPYRQGGQEQQDDEILT